VLGSKVQIRSPLASVLIDLDLMGGKRSGFRASHQSGPTMLMCLGVCVTCACHSAIFSEKSLFVDAVSYRSVRWQYFS